MARGKVNFLKTDSAISLFPVFSLSTYLLLAFFSSYVLPTNYSWLCIRHDDVHFFFLLFFRNLLQGRVKKERERYGTEEGGGGLLPRALGASSVAASSFSSFCRREMEGELECWVVWRDRWSRGPRQRSVEAGRNPEKEKRELRGVEKENTELDLRDASLSFVAPLLPPVCPTVSRAQSTLQIYIKTI